MATELFNENLATTTVTSGGTDAPAQGTQETWTVASSAMFGAAQTGVSQFHVADPNAPTEMIAVTNVSGTTWTVTRGAENTTPVSHTGGFTVYQVTTTGWLAAVNAAAYGALSLTGGTLTGPVSNTSLNTWDLDSFTGTDDQKWASAIAAWSAASGGGRIILGARAHTFADYWFTAYQGSEADIAVLVIQGQGAWGSGGLANAPAAGVTTVTFTYDGPAAAQMDFQHNGLLEICACAFVDTANAIPFLLTTNPVADIHHNSFCGAGSRSTCVKDAILLGGAGLGQVGNGAPGDTAKFSGYGTRIHDNFFSQTRRVVTFGGGANSINVYHNTIDQLCGDTSRNWGAPFVFNGNSQHANEGNVISGNQNVEMTYYQAFASTTGAGYAVNNRLGPNSLDDAGGVVYAVFDSTCSGNSIDDGVWRTSAGTYPAIDAAVSTAVCSSVNAPNVFTEPVVAQAADIVVRNQASHGPWSEDYYGDWASVTATNNNSTFADSGVQFTAWPGTSVSDGVTYSGSPCVTSATAAFIQGDIGCFITNTGGTVIPSDTRIYAVITNSSLGWAWAASAAYSLGQVITPQAPNGHLYQCTAAGTSGSSQPSFPVNGGTVSDGTAVWTDIGTSATCAVLTQNATGTDTGVVLRWGRHTGNPVAMLKVMNHHLIGSGAAPSYAVQAGGGSASGGTVNSVTGSDLGHIVTFTSGSATTAGLMIKGTPANSYSGSGESGAFALTAGNAAAAALMSTGGGAYVTFASATWNIFAAGTAATSTQYVFNVNTVG